MEASNYVLVVEDDQDIRESIVEVLSMEAIDVKTASNGEEAIDALKRESIPSVILLDLMMPHTDGVWFCHERSKYPEFKSIPIVVMSADGQVEPRVAGLSVQEILRKPIGIDALVKTLRTYLK